MDLSNEEIIVLERLIQKVLKLIILIGFKMKETTEYRYLKDLPLILFVMKVKQNMFQTYTDLKFTFKLQYESKNQDFRVSRF